MTAGSNAFQRPETPGASDSQQRALAEFEELRSALEAARVDVVVLDDTSTPHTPDAVFPNNWVSFHEDGTLVIYPMMAENRRNERREDIDDVVRARGFEVSRVVDLTHYESRDLFLEGTGSLVLDRENRLAFACLSARTHTEPLADFARTLGYEVVAFEAFDANGAPIYHTNVMMWVGSGLAAVCLDSVPDAKQRDTLLERLGGSGRTVLQLDHAQLHAFAGNMLEVQALTGDRLLVMSARARRSLTHDQIAVIEQHTTITSVSLEHIEDVGGGGARCMLASIHLPRSVG